MTFLARTVEDDVRSVFFCPFRLEVEVFFVVSEIHPNVVQANLGLFPIMGSCPFWGKVAFCTICLHTTFVHVVLALLPTCLSFGMNMTSRARLVCRGGRTSVEGGQNEHDAEQDAT